MLSRVEAKIEYYSHLCFQGKSFLFFVSSCGAHQDPGWEAYSKEDKEDLAPFLVVALMLLMEMMIRTPFQARFDFLNPCVEELEEALDRPGRSYIPSSI